MTSAQALVTGVPVEHAIVMAGALFALGLTGLLVRRNLLFMLISVEIMLNAAGLALVTAGAYVGGPDGQVAFFFMLTMAAAEVAVGLALALEIHRRLQTLDADGLRELWG